MKPSDAKSKKLRRQYDEDFKKEDVRVSKENGVKESSTILIVAFNILQKNM